MFYVAHLGHIFLKFSTVICYNINKRTYLQDDTDSTVHFKMIKAEVRQTGCFN